jgi:hypothetical protein
MRLCLVVDSPCHSGYEDGGHVYHVVSASQDARLTRSICAAAHSIAGSDPARGPDRKRIHILSVA